MAESDHRRPVARRGCPADCDMTDGTIYTNLCGQFPVQSYPGIKYMFVAYIYKCNSILMRPMKDRTDENMVAVFQDIYDYVREQNLMSNLQFTR